MKKVFILVLIMVLGIVGCGNKVENEKEIVSIKIECADLCRTMKNIPFTEKTFDNEEEIRIFQRAINTAEKINGNLNYGVIFYMYVSFEDGTLKKFVLNVDDDDASTALLVDTAHSEQGYTIHKDQTIELRTILYNS